MMGTAARRSPSICRQMWQKSRDTSFDPGPVRARGRFPHVGCLDLGPPGLTEKPRRRVFVDTSAGIGIEGNAGPQIRVVWGTWNLE